MRGWIISLCVSFLLLSTRAQALISVNEIYADPAAGLAGDANHDGVTSSTQDEFIELINTGAGSVNISGWKLNDAISTRHIFPNNSLLLPAHYLVVYGGGAPQLPGVNWQLASSGGLSLNNASETITLFDQNNQIIQQFLYGSLANQDRSIVRFPEGSGDFVLHTSLPEAEGRFFSPGTNVSGELPVPQTNTVPEPATLATFFIGTLALIKRRL